MSINLLEQFSKICEFDKTLGLELYSIDPPLYRMTVDNRHTSRKGVAHGGALVGMMDAVLGIKALEYAMERKMLCSTVESKINFLQPALTGDILEGLASIDFAGKSLIVVSAYISVGEKKVAKAQGTFNLYPMDKSIEEELKKT